MMLPMTCGTPPASPATEMLNRLLTSALIAGAVAGLIAALLQLWFVQPVLLHAELYEGGELTHFAAASEGHDHGAAEIAATAAPEAAQAAAGHAAEGHGHADAGHAEPAAGTGVGTHAAPGFGFDAPRDGLSILFSVMVYVGWALLLIAAMALAEDRGHRITPREGLLWGVAGFVAAQLAPAFGLAPELPGMAAADITLREIWWVATVVLTALALWLLAFGKGWTAWGAAIVLAALPHLIGAPHPAEFTGPTPPELAAQFAGRALGVGLIAWAVLGAATATLWSRARRDALEDGALHRGEARI